MHAKNWENINASMVDGYEVENDQEKENYKNQALEVILTNQYINRYGSGME